MRDTSIPPYLEQKVAEFRDRRANLGLVKNGDDLGFAD